MNGKKIVDHEEFIRIVGPDGKTFILYTDPDRLEKHMLALSPRDARIIQEFTAALRKVARSEMPLGMPSTLKEMADLVWKLPKFLPLLGLIRKYKGVSVEKFASRIQDPFLRTALLNVFGLPDFPLVGILMSLGWMAAHNAGYPVGGSLKFSQAIEKRYLELGGQITYKARVVRILVEGGKAVGVRLADGSEYRADEIISAADGHATLFDMLEGRYLSDDLREYYDHMPIFPPLIQVSLGIGRDLSAQPHMATYLLDEPMQIAGEERNQLGVKHYGYDPTLAPAGKSVVEVTFSSNYAYWKELAGEPEKYETEKKEIALQVLDRLDRLYPGLSSQVEVVDVATPLTYERYTGNWQGSMEGWMISTQNFDSIASGKGLSKTLPGLRNFYMIGQWVEPGGGLPPAATSARNIIQRICKADKKPFKTTVLAARS